MKVFILVVLCASVLLSTAQAASRREFIKAFLKKQHEQQQKQQEAKKPSLEALQHMTNQELIDMVLHGSNAKPADTYWWVFPTADCPYHDITTADCHGQTVDQCKAKCLATSGCGGFNTHGFLKTTDCLQNKAYESTTDLYLLETSPQPGPATNFPPIWPYPKAFTNGTTTISVDPTNFQFNAKPTSSDLQAAFTRYTPLFFPHAAAGEQAKSFASVNSVTVTVTNPNADLQLETDESYVLSVPLTGPITLTALTQFGAMRGLETLSQLIYFNFDTQGYFIDNAPWVITDAPRFPHRELLVDSARHFQPVPTLMALIQSLTYSKINVVHWHIVDSQSFPFDSPSRPKLSQGAYSSQERYTVADVAAVVEFARVRGVRVMVEFDNPGHAASWCTGYPEVCPSLACREPLNPATNATFDLITDLFNDITGGRRGAGLFPENLMHLGGDEVNTNCWSVTPSVAQWMKDNNLTPDQTYEYFVKRSQAIAKAQGRDVVGWEEIWDHFNTTLDKSTVIHQWLPGSAAAKQASQNGYRVLWSTDGVWYLDGLSVTWKQMYAAEPCVGIDPTICAQNYLGGGGEMWGETVDTSDLQQTVWPRLAAIGERLWSPVGITNVDNAAPRIAAFRCLLNRRGVAAAPINNANARTSPPGPGGCLVQ